MKICGIICELNPAHNGHQYLIQQARQKTNCDYVVAIMSGNFVQRGLPAIYEYQLRAEMALNIGFDAVIYLPTIYTINSAEKFANFALHIASQLNINYLAFGTKLDEKTLRKINGYKNSTEFIKQLKNNLSQGQTFSKAFALTIQKLYHLQLSANDILGLEYLTAIQKNDYKIAPIIIERNNDISATTIRKLILQKNYERIKPMVNDTNYQIIQNNKPNNFIKFNNCICHNIITKTIEELSKIKDMREGIENKIFNTNANTFSKFNKSIKSKRYSQNYLNRLYLNILLNVSKDCDYTLPYIKLVATKNNGILNALDCKISLITNLKDKKNMQQNSLYNYDTISSKIYNSINDIKSYNFPYHKIIIHN